jgi:predicted secreted protein
MSAEVYSGANSILKAVAIASESRPLAVGTPVAIDHFRTIDIEEKAASGKFASSSTGGWKGAVGGQAEWDATLQLYVPYTVSKTPVIISGIGGDVTAPALAHVRKITVNYTNDVAKYGSSDTSGWKQTVPGASEYNVSIDCWADAGAFKVGTIKAGDEVALAVVAWASDSPGITGNIIVESIGGFKVGPEAGVVGFTIKGQGHLAGLLPVATPWVLGSLVSLEVLIIGGTTPKVSGFARVAGISDFVIDVEGTTPIGVSIKLAGDGALVRYTV